MAKVRLVAYRKATSGSSTETAYELDLQEFPNISLNFKFADIREPEKRKANYSQTFKLPFTNKNNAFFQDWYNVNLETLVFDTRQKFDAILYVGTIPQFEGSLQLKSVYQKAGLYEAVLMSNSADLFSVIGNNKLRDVFKNDDGTYSAELNHTFNATNFLNSWNGTSSAFVNTAGTSLRDSTVDVQKVMYPLSFTMPKAYFEFDNNLYLGMSTPASVTNAENYIVNISQFRPAIQIKELLKLIIARAGFSYTSSFIDGAYFGKLFMTTCGHTAAPSAVTTTTAGAITGIMAVGNTSALPNCDFSDIQSEVDTCTATNWVVLSAGLSSPASGATIPQDPNGMWNTTYNYFTKQDINQTTLTVAYIAEFQNVEGCGGGGGSFGVKVELWDSTNNVSLEEIPSGAVSEYNLNMGNDGELGFQWLTIDIDISNMNVGESGRVLAAVGNWQITNTSYILRIGQTTSFSMLGESFTPFANGALYNVIVINWVGYGNNIYGKEVNIPGCIDGEITQKAFLKDLTERFNLIVVADPNNSSNLIIEPYNDYLALGESKYWTDKVDSSKEIIVRDTSSLQKKTIKLTDLEDNDLWNQAFKEQKPDINVYGKIDITADNNDFAVGEMKNSPIFSPYINEKVFVSNDSQLFTHLTNVAVQYEFSSKEVEGGFETELKETKPKLFFYNGVATESVSQFAPESATNYYLHSVNSATGAITTHTFNTYPLCTPFNLTPTDGLSSLTPDTKSLYWNQAPPIAGQLQVFNYQASTEIPTNSLYYEYWATYLNSIYSKDSRIMECYLNLNEVDIFNFSFNDEIFIRNAYWRILSIDNYQVATRSSTKVTFLKSTGGFSDTCVGCEQVIGELNGSNITGPFFVWCDEDDPDCTPDLDVEDNIVTTVECCECNGGIPFFMVDEFAPLYPCMAVSGSLPLPLQNVFSIRSLFSSSQTKSLIYGRIESYNTPFTVGQNNKFTTPILKPVGNDIVVKYNRYPKDEPYLNGESHKMVLTGYTVGNTAGYAYPKGDGTRYSIPMPNNTNMVIRIKGITTVVGGTSTTYPLGSTEAFAYYTGFKTINGTTPFQIFKVVTSFEATPFR